ncbi:MAG: CRISPR system precrRNA processing endoribonuclease RAMP protein Cas6 [Pseudomonadota bacterium]
MINDRAIELPVAVFRLTFEARGDVRLPPFVPSFWRGVLGPAFQALDQTRSLAKDGLFDRYFGKSSTAWMPRPFVIRGPVSKAWHVYRSEQRFGVELVLIGPALDDASSFVEAFVLAGQRGLGTYRQKASLVALEVVAPHVQDWIDLDPTPNSVLEAPAFTPFPILPPSDMVMMDFRSPLTIRRDKKLLGPGEIDAGTLLSRLVHRVQDLALLNKTGISKQAFDRMASACHRVKTMKSTLRYAERGRVQKKRRAEDPEGEAYLDGCVGRVLLNMQASPELWPWVVMAPWLHIGRNATMGGGRVVLANLEGEIIG